VNFTSFLILLELKIPEDQSVLTRPVDHHTVIGGLVAMAVYAYRDMSGAFCLTLFSPKYFVGFIKVKIKVKFTQNRPRRPREE
jgi:hypothetical protein